MKYIITENKINEILYTLIEDRYKGIKFKKGVISSIIGILPHKMGDGDIFNSEWSLVYEREDEPDSKRMVLWMYEDDYDYFSAMIPLSDAEITEGVRNWFQKKTKLKVDLVNVQ
jgi:hypothetical protein